MAGNIKGITIEIDGNTTKLNDALKTTEKSTTSVNKELRQVNNLLKFNPGNTELIAQKQKLLSTQIQNTSSKLETLRNAQKQVDAQFKSGDLGEDEYRAFQREIIATEGKLGNYKSQLKSVESGQTGLKNSTDTTSSSLEKIGKSTAISAMSDIGDMAAGAGQKIQGFGNKAIESWTEMDDAVDNLTSKTGTTGEAANKMGEAYEHAETTMAGAQMTSEDLSNTMAGLHSTFNLSGKALESATDNVAQFSAVTGQSGTDAVDALRNTLGKFNISAKDMPAVLDSFAAASQSSGISVDQLETDVAAAQPVFSQLHIKLQDGVAIIAKWSKAGLDSSTSIKAMTKASATYSSEGKTLKEGLTGTFNAIKNAKSPTDALNAATEAFGTKAGPKMLAAIQGNKISLADLKAGAEDTTGTVKSSFQQTLDPIDKVKVAQKKLQQALSEVGGEILSNVAPALKTLVGALGTITGAFSKLPGPIKQFVVIFGGISAVIIALIPLIVGMAVAFSALDVALLPIIGIIAAIVTVITLIVVAIMNWGTIVNWLKGLWAGLVAFFAPIWAAISNVFMTGVNAVATVVKVVFLAIQFTIQTIWTVITTILMTAWNIIIAAVSAIWAPIAPFFSALWNGILNIISTVWNVISTVISSVSGIIIGVVSGAWNAISGVTSSVFNAVSGVVSSVWNSIKGVVSGVVNGIKSTVSSAWNAIAGVTSSVFNGIKNTISNVMNGAKSVVQAGVNAIKGFFSGMHIKFPNIKLPHFHLSGSFDLKKMSVPHLGVDWYAKGGIMTKPTMFAQSGGRAQVGGEAGPEGVIPLNDETLGKIGQGIVDAMGGSSDQPTYLVMDSTIVGQLLQGVLNNANGNAIQLQTRGLAGQ